MIERNTSQEKTIGKRKKLLRIIGLIILAVAAISIGKRKKLLWIIGLIILAAAAISGYKFMDRPSSGTAVEMAKAPAQKKMVDPTILTGRWLRPDGGYVLQLADVAPNGRMKAQYFNPNSINVSYSRWGKKDSRLEVFVELRDVNYPGSTYTLTYDPVKDTMKGFYYQAAMKQQFQVEFVRLK